MLLKYVQVVVSHWVSIAMFSEGKSNPPRRGAALENRPEWKFLCETSRLVEGSAVSFPRSQGCCWPPSQSGGPCGPKFCFPIEVWAAFTGRHGQSCN